MNSITPNLWFDKTAEEAVNFYTSLFENSKIGNSQRYGKEGFEFHQMPEGTIMTMEFELAGQKFLVLNGGPIFKFSDAVSFYIYCKSENEIEFLYEKLKQNGSIVWQLGKYDWSEKYAWVKDKFGASWQLDIDKMNSPQKILPTLLFTNDKFAQIKEAVNYYTNIFPNSKINFEFPYPPSENIPTDALLFAQFSLSNYLFNAMSSTQKHDFDFNEAISFIVNCDTQEEIDYYWEKLGEGGDPNAQQCGWLKDKFGVSWQIVPSKLGKLLSGGNKEQSSSVMNELLKMKKLDLNILEQTFQKNS
ncbi:MAG: VOC family protein [Ignavibacteriae bacterium]|nr:VOC family protein [Ignavibacteriota bacterium]